MTVILRNQVVRFLLCSIPFIGMSTPLSAQNPFAGTWRLDLSRHPVAEADITYSKLPNGKEHFSSRRQYDFAFDGKEYPTALPGQTVNWIATGPQAWEVLENTNGTLRRKMRVELSDDHDNLKMSYTWFNPRNRTAKGEQSFTRVSAGSGLEGTWHSVERLEEPDFLTVAFPAAGQMYTYVDPNDETWAGPLDGTFMARQGPLQPKEAMSSFRQVSERKILSETKIGDRVLNDGSMEVSTDSKTLTLRAWIPGHEEDMRTVILDREP